ncbi:Cytochrome P450 [Vigna unguiculata]|uniref:Cytochrome P450 n=1 Tax=Vigna unguiculata TaxID=3917 RepID=A0A4D6MNP0_VIGUN|nr:Cytochrome P450 [Vigna unguiculata]
MFTFNVALLSIFGKEEILYRDALKRSYYTLEQGYNSMPINVPGTLFHKAMKARKELAQILAQISSSRRQRKQDYKDLLGSFMGEKAGLTDEGVAETVTRRKRKARKELAQILAQIISSRRQRKQDYKDLLGSFMGEKAGLTDEGVAETVKRRKRKGLRCGENGGVFAERNGG